VLEGENFVRSGTADLGESFEFILEGVHETCAEQSGDWLVTEHLSYKQGNGTEHLVLGLY